MSIDINIKESTQLEGDSTDATGIAIDKVENVVPNNKQIVIDLSKIMALLNFNFKGFFSNMSTSTKQTLFNFLVGLIGPRAKKYSAIVAMVATLSGGTFLGGNYTLEELDKRDVQIAQLQQEKEKIKTEMTVEVPDYKKFAIEWALKNSKSTIPHIIINQAVTEAMKYDKWKLILAIMSVESNFDPFAQSKKGAHGLMQIMFYVWKDILTVKDLRELNDIATNVRCGNEVLEKYLKDTNDNIKDALFKYVGGDPDYHRRVLIQYAELDFFISRQIQTDKVEMKKEVSAVIEPIKTVQPEQEIVAGTPIKILRDIKKILIDTGDKKVASN
jgi:hypothetical protein